MVDRTIDATLEVDSFVKRQFVIVRLLYDVVDVTITVYCFLSREQEQLVIKISQFTTCRFEIHMNL